MQPTAVNRPADVVQLSGTAIEHPSIARCLSFRDVAPGSGSSKRIGVSCDVKGLDRDWYATVQTVVAVLKENGFASARLAYADKSRLTNPKLRGSIEIDGPHEVTTTYAVGNEGSSAKLYHDPSTVHSMDCYVDVDLPWSESEAMNAKRQITSICEQIQARGKAMKGTATSLA